MGEGRPPLRRRLGIVLAVWAIVFGMFAIASAVPDPPTAALSVDDRTPFVGEPVRFDASASEGHDAGRGRIVAYRFDFGDGNGTGWQTSPVAQHAYAAPGRRIASVAVRDARGLEGIATVDLEVRAAAPPTGTAPDLTILGWTLVPHEPRVDDVVILSIVVANVGGSRLEDAFIDVTDLRPIGSTVLLDTIRVHGPLEPMGVEPTRTLPVFVTSFLAVGEGMHTVRVEIRDVFPAETVTEDNVLEIVMQVRPMAGPEDGGVQPSGEIDLLILVILAAAVVAVIAAILLVRRPGPPREREGEGPPPPEPPDRRPPPVGPP